MARIAIIGLGFVGASLAATLSKGNVVIGVDRNKERVDRVNALDFSYLGGGFADVDKEGLCLSATCESKVAAENAEIIFICVNTDYSETLGGFDVTCLDEAIEEAIKYSSHATIVIRSTTPIGYTKSKQEQYKDRAILFSPEFLKEESAYKDALNPSRIIVGGEERFSEEISKICMVLEASSRNSPEILTMSSIEAEAVKLFSNTYLALRIAYFNELDSLALSLGASSEKIIKGVSLDPRIGQYYNRPSFGYGGYCLPKDSKQLLSSFASVPQTLIHATIESNRVRREYLAEDIASRYPLSEFPVIGIYRLASKNGGGVIRSSPALELASLLKKKGYMLLIYEPHASVFDLGGMEIEADLGRFKKRSNLVLADRLDKEIEDISEKVYSREYRL